MESKARKFIEYIPAIVIGLICVTILLWIIFSNASFGDSSSISLS